MFEQSILYKDSDNLVKPVQRQWNLLNNLNAKVTVMRFVNRLMRKNRNFSKMNIFHYNIIQDLASAQAYQQIAQNTNLNFWLKTAKPSRVYKYFRRIVTRILRYLKQTYLYAYFLKLTILIPVIEPNNQVKLIWDMILAVIRIFLLVIISIESSFNNKALYNQLAAPFYISIIFLVVDIIINSLTSYYKKGVLVQSHSAIFMKYLKTGFIFDIVCVCLLLMAIIEEVNSPTQYIDYIHQDERRNGSMRGLLSVTAIILQLRNVIHLFVRLQSIQDFSNATARLLDLVKLVLFLLIVEHLFSCIWYYAAFTQRLAGVQKTWLSAQNLNDSPYFDQYICAFYFATVTMVTVGYGDIVAQNTIERIVTICFMFLSTLQLSYTISTIWTIYSKFTEKKEESLKNMRAINTYMNNINISAQLKYKIREYLQYYWKEQHIEESQDVQSILDHIPDELQDQLSFEANSMVVEGCILFRNNFSHNFKRECLQNLIDSMEIDKVSEFKTYFPQFNISKIINNEPVVLPEGFQTIWTNLSQYLQYPFFFIQKYRKSLIQSEKFKVKEEEIKRSQKKKTIIITRNVKQSQ